jgi:hypothetical protein
MELAEGAYHALVALSPDAVMFELKQGPYQPTADKDFLAGFPLEGTAEASLQERRWRELFASAAPASEAPAAFAPAAFATTNDNDNDNDNPNPSDTATPTAPAAALQQQ